MDMGSFLRNILYRDYTSYQRSPMSTLINLVLRLVITIAQVETKTERHIFESHLHPARFLWNPFAVAMKISQLPHTWRCLLTKGLVPSNSGYRAWRFWPVRRSGCLAVLCVFCSLPAACLVVFCGHDLLSSCHCHFCTGSSPACVRRAKGLNHL